MILYMISKLKHRRADWAPLQGLGVLIQTPEIYRDELAYAGLLHGYTVNYIHGAHGHFVMGNNDELRVVAELLDHLREFGDVHIVERSIYFVEYAERRRLNEVYGKQ